MGVILREYQTRATHSIRCAWETSRSVLLALPTGGGKTEVAISIAETVLAPGRRVLVVVERKQLCHQWRERFYKHGFSYVGMLQGENTAGMGAPVIVATIQSIRARGVPEDVGFLVLDESHIWHQSHDHVLDTCADARVLGLSATPLRAGLGIRFDKLVIGATIRELTEGGWLVPARVFAPNANMISQALEAVGIRAGDFATDQLAAAMRAKALIGDIVSSWKERAEDRPTIAFCVDKKHARDLADEFVLDGVPSAVILDETSDEDRADILARFNEGDIKVMCSVGVLSVGFDSPRASCAILARPTLSTMLYIQQAGRVLRPCAGKADAVILDHAANTLRHGLPIDFMPPDELDKMDGDADRKERHVMQGNLVTCVECEAVYPRAEDACPECGTPRTRNSKVLVLEGKLVPVEWDAGEAEPQGATQVEIQSFYQEMLGVCDARGFKPDYAWFKTCERYGMNRDFNDPVTGRVLPYEWRRYAVATQPTQETLRWVTNRQKHYFAKTRSARKKAA